MTIAKNRVAEMFKGLPEKVDLDDLMYRLYLLEKIEKGEADIRSKRTISHEDLLKKSRNGEHPVDAGSLLSSKRTTFLA